VRFACWIALAAAKSHGCRLVTLDAYPQAIDFYRKLGFVENQQQREGSTHPSMRLDIFDPNLADWLLAEN
jgi:hypothetical protein